MENDTEADTEEDKIRDIYIVPTSHASEESSLTVKNVINSIKPSLVAIELDQNRLQKLKEGDLQSQDKSIRDILKGSKGVGIKGRMILVIFSVMQSNIASKLGIDLLGMDMLSGYEAAKDNDIPLALVDRDISETFRRFSDQASFGESFKSFIYMLIAYIQISRMSDDEIDEKLGGSYDEINVSESVEALEDTFPTFKRILIDERDTHIAESTYKASKKFGDTVLVIGAAHESGVTNILSENPDVNVHSITEDDFSLEFVEE